MIVVNEEKCVGCGCCQVVCPREAFFAWAYAQLDKGRCTECYGGIHRFNENVPLSDSVSVLDTQSTRWDCLCVINCPAEALHQEEDRERI